MTAPTSTTNITGLRAIQRGSSLRKESRRAGTSSSPSRTLFAGRVRDFGSRSAITVAISVPHRGEVARTDLEVLQDRTERERREERQRADDEHHADEEPGEQRRAGGEGARAGGRDLLLHQRAGQ